MTITLVRHAPVMVDWGVRLYADELEAWIVRYDAAPIDTTPPTNGVDEVIASADCIVASSLRRTSDSLAVLGVVPDRIDPLFDEASVPVSHGHFLHLRPMQWLSYFRLRALLGGLGRDGAMRRLARRADRAADLLTELARTHGDVVLMGHGAINHFIARSLKQKGWQPQTDHKSKGNWGYVVLSSDGAKR
jgi:broad specificity phosphatase PhoE